MLSSVLATILAVTACVYLIWKLNRLASQLSRLEYKIIQLNGELLNGMAGSQSELIAKLKAHEQLLRSRNDV